ncbi:hypothetical protein [Clostridium sp.]|uniref:gp53-like domain-containing protein n=1 Tax=Clostridium sp. TaxID=1506 RepID=UPI0032175C95
MLTTTNYGLKKIELKDSPPDITVINPNWDLIDQMLKTLHDSTNTWEVFKQSGGTLKGDVKIQRGAKIMGVSADGAISNPLIYQGTEGVDSGAIMVGSTAQRTEIVSEVRPTTWWDGLRRGLVDMSDFVNSKTGNGYQKLPNGLILQWGAFFYPTPNYVGGQSIPIQYFPIAYKDRLIYCGVYAYYVEGGSAETILSRCISEDLATMSPYSYYSVNLGTKTAYYRWFAIGY